MGFLTRKKDKQVFPTSKGKEYRQNYDKQKWKVGDEFWTPDGEIAKIVKIKGDKAVLEYRDFPGVQDEEPLKELPVDRKLSEKEKNIDSALVEKVKDALQIDIEGDDVVDIQTGDEMGITKQQLKDYALHGKNKEDVEDALQIDRENGQVVDIQTGDTMGISIKELKEFASTL